MAKQGQSSGGRAVASASAAGRWRRRQRQGRDGLSGQQDVGGCYFWLRQQGVGGNRAIEKKNSIGCRAEGGASAVCRAKGKASAVGFVSREDRRRISADVEISAQTGRWLREQGSRAASSAGQITTYRRRYTLEAAGRLVGDVSAQIDCKCGTSRRIGADPREDVSSYRPAS